MKNRAPAAVEVEIDVTVTLTLTLAEARDLHRVLGKSAGREAWPTFDELDKALKLIPDIAQ